MSEHAAPSSSSSSPSPPLMPSQNDVGVYAAFGHTSPRLHEELFLPETPDRLFQNISLQDLEVSSLSSLSTAPRSSSGSRCHVGGNKLALFSNPDSRL